MGSIAEQNVRHSVRGLLERDTNLCRQAIVDDEDVDQFEKRIDMNGVEILASYQPPQDDLRQVIAGMKVSTNLERVSDEAGNIARRARKVLRNPRLLEVNMIEPIYRLASSLVHQSMQSFSERNLELANGLLVRDEKIDDLYSSLLKLYRKRMEEDPLRLRDYLDLIFIVRSLERVGDHATNIAEETIYMTSAKDVRHKT